MITLPAPIHVASFDVDAHDEAGKDSNSSQIVAALNSQAQLARFRIGSRKMLDIIRPSLLPTPQSYSYFIWRNVDPKLKSIGACYHDPAQSLSTGLIEFLQVFRIQCILLGGFSLETSVIETAKQLRKKGFEVIINLHACHIISLENMDNIKKTCKALHIHLIDDPNTLIKHIQNNSSAH